MKPEETIELYNSWRKHPVTEVLFAALEQEIERNWEVQNVPTHAA